MPIDLNRLSAGITLPKEVSAEILGLTHNASAVMAASRKIELPGSGKVIPVMTGRAKADWVAETDEIKVSRPTFGAKDMQGYKLAVIVPLSKELVRDAESLYRATIDSLPGALAARFDETVSGTVAPGSNFDVLGNATGIVVDGTNTGDDVASIVRALGVAGSAVTGWVASPALGAEFLTAKDGFGRPLYAPGMDTQTVGAIYGAPVYRADSLAQGVLGLAGDFANSAIYGVVNGVEISTADQATLTDGSTTINLWQREMVAVKAVIEVGFRVQDLNKFVKITAA